MKPKHLLILSAALIVVGLFLMFFPFVTIEPECAEDELVTSGFVDEDQDCPISIESWEEIRAELERFKIERVGGLALVAGGLAAGGVGVVQSRRRSSF